MSSNPAIVAQADPRRRRALLEALTARLPQWFGDPPSNRQYAERAEVLPGWSARLDDRDVGLLLVERHGPSSAELYWMGVDPDCHRRGIGRALIGEAEGALGREDRRYLFVLTLHPDNANEEYRCTRLFYEVLGFTLALSGHGVEKGLAYYVKCLDH